MLLSITTSRSIVIVVRPRAGKREGAGGGGWSDQRDIADVPTHFD